MSNTSLSKAQSVLQWISDNDGFWLSEKLELRDSPLGGVGVFAQEDIEEQTVLLRLHKQVLLSAQNSCVANLIIDEELDGALALVIAFIYEKHRLEESPWRDYISTIQYTDDKNRPILPPSLWQSKQKLILRGSELEMMGALDESENQDAFERGCTFAINQFETGNIEIPFEFDIIDKTDEQVKEKYEHFIAISHAVASRDFEIDEFHQVALCPGADLFNHTNRNNARFESFFEVCAMCGARECGHSPEDHEEMIEEMMEDDDNDNANEEDKVEDQDQDEDEDEDEGEDQDEEDFSDQDSEPEFEGPIEEFIIHIEESLSVEKELMEQEENDEQEEYTGPTIQLSDQSKPSHPEDCCDIFLHKAVSKGDEIFNTYGDFSNVVLLSKYGFVIPDNSNNTVSLGIQCLKLKKEKQYSRHFQWWEDAGYILMREHIQKKTKHHHDHDEDGGCCGGGDNHEHGDEDEEEEEDPEDDIPSWAMEMKLEHNGEPSDLTYALFKLLSLKSPELHKFLQKKEPELKVITTSSPKAYKLLKDVVITRERQYNGDMDYKRLLKKGGPREKLASQLVLDELAIIQRAKKFIQKKT